MTGQTVVCFGKRRPASVLRFTEPSAVLGAPQSQVTYRIAIADVPDWARDARVQAAFPDIRMALDWRETTETLPMVLDGDEWRDVSVFTLRPGSAGASAVN